MLLIAWFKSSFDEIIQYLFMVQDYGACICYPGSEIPEWFAEHQTTGSSINIKLPGNWRSSNCLGFSICFVVECNEYTRAGRAFRCEFHLRAKYGESRKLETSLWTSSDNGVEGTKILNSGHVFLCYRNPYSWALACKEAEEITEMSFHIYPCDLWTESFVHGDSCKVKKCGIRLLSPEDAKEFGLATNPDYWNSYKEDDDDDTSNCTESSDEEPIGRGLDGSVAERQDHQTHGSKSEIIDVDDYESKEEENGESVRSRIIACGSVIKEENVLNGSEIVLESSVTEEKEEEDKQSQSGSTEKDEEEDPRSVSHGCLLFLALFKEICEGFLGKKSRSGREVHQETSSKSVQERLEELEKTVQNLQSENIKSRDQNNQFSQ